MQRFFDTLKSVFGFLDTEFMGIALYRYILTFLILLAAFYARAVVKKIVGVHVKRMVARTRFRADDILVEALATPLGWASAFLGIYLSLIPLEITSRYEAVLLKVVSGVIAFLVMSFLLRLTNGVADSLRDKVAKTDTALDDGVIPAMTTAVKILLIIITCLFVLNNFGFKVTSILAGLGVGGLAVALAAQGTLSNWFGAIMIFTDKPFAAGDRVVVGDYDGVVEQVGLRSTRMRTLDGTLVSIPNATVADAQINNISEMPARKSNYQVGVTYDTPPAKMEEALGIIRNVLETNARIREDFIVRFEAFGSASLNIRVIHWALTVDYAEWLEVLEEVNLAILTRFNEAGIEFAFPTQTIYLKQEQG